MMLNMYDLRLKKTLQGKNVLILKQSIDKR